MARNKYQGTAEYAPAKRSLGQNFLADNAVIDRIVSLLGEVEGKAVIEIGPGRGALTRPMIDKGADLTVVELDDDLAKSLSAEFSCVPNFRCLHTDVLDLDLSNISSQETVIIGNLPYYISTAIIRHLIQYRTNFSRLVLMLQREVADRIVAVPGDSERGFLTVLVEQYLFVRKEFDVAPSAFTPRPKVWSSIVSLEPRNDTIADDSAFERLVGASFVQKRKTILNNLKSYDGNSGELLEKAAIDAKRRAETLSRDEWIRLYSVFQEAKKA